MRNKHKPNLTIEVPSQDHDLEEESPLSLRLARVNSTKNSHELRRFNFSSTRPNPFDKFSKLDKIKKLEREKVQLIKSLEILKNGAVSAIVEKDETIEKLRKLFIENGGGETEDQKVQEL